MPDKDTATNYFWYIYKLREKMNEDVEEKMVFHLQDTSSVCEVLSNLAGQPLLVDRTHSKMIHIKFKGAGSVSR